MKKHITESNKDHDIAVTGQATGMAVTMTDDLSFLDVKELQKN